MLKIDVKKKLSHGSDPIELSINTVIKSGEFVALSGKSGSGKTSLLRVLSGLENAHGSIRLDDILWHDEKSIVPMQDRGIGFVFQDYALFPNMSVEKNLLFVNKDKKLANQLLEMTELSALKERLPSTLSGGQQQRVALCRAMMNRPKLLLMDEPLSALDPQMRMRLQQDILSLHKEFETTTIMVSHDPSEIYRLADRVIRLEEGKIIQDGNPKEVLLRTKGSQKFSLEGELLDIVQADVIYIGVIAIGQQIVEVVMDEQEARDLRIGQAVQVNTKAFSPTLSF